MHPNRARSLRTLLSAIALPLVLPLTGVACSSDPEDRGVDVQDGRRGKGGGGGDEGEGGASAGGTSSGKGGKGGASGGGGTSSGKGGKGGSGGTGGGAGGSGAGEGGESGSDPGKGGTGGKAGSAGSGGGLAGAAGNGGGGAGKAGAAGSASVAANHLSIVKPTSGQIFVQSGSPAKVDIPYEVLAGADIASVEYIIETDFSLGTSKTAPNFPLTYPYQYPGDRITEARGFDASGKQIASAYIDFVIQGPGGSGTGGSGGSGAGGSPSTGKCLTDLEAMGVSFTPTKARGVVDAVKLTGPLNGVRFAKTDTDALSTDPMACEFVKTLYEFATVLKAHGFTKIGGLGAYCYRCCCSWSETNYCRGVDDPEPSCGSNGYSNHSFGRALDIRYLYKADGTRYDVNDPTDFVKYKDEDHTCTTALAAQTGVSKELYELVCDASAKKVFGSILTPNHNAAHRNHFHCDTGKSGTPSGYAVKDAPWSWGTRVDGPGDEGEDE